VSADEWLEIDVSVHTDPFPLRASPLSPVATHQWDNAAETQETAVSAAAASTVSGGVHVVPLKITSDPLGSTPVQNVEDVHEIPEMLVVSTLTGADHLEPWSRTTRPASSPAAQKLVVGQDTELNPTVSTDLGLAHVAPWSTTTRPTVSTATQNLVEGHETAVSAVPLSMVLGSDQRDAFLTMTLPLASTPTQKLTEAHETASGTPPGCSMVTGEDHLTFRTERDAADSARGANKPTKASPPPTNTVAATSTATKLRFRPCTMAEDAAVIAQPLAAGEA
jgi:hypothetical protein